MSLAITSLEVSRHCREDAHAALLAAFRPFGSLDQAEVLAAALLDWVSAPPSTERGSIAARIMDALWATDADQVTDISFRDGWEVTLVTPTSKTQITLSKRGNFNVKVVFPTASQTRASTILSAGRTSSVHFTATSGAATLSREQVQSMLLERAKTHAEWLDGLPADYYPEAVLVAMKSTAAQEVAALS
ncbi:hypothetical protein [Myxococcus vastator]|uniref:hypothetical protein n=1 Tax=Myxococcus vastator TaxID=2709664 RepID=UPI0013D6AAE5|nr:hypothetical protein [Myxococcus vastator]